MKQKSLVCFSVGRPGRELLVGAAHVAYGGHHVRQVAEPAVAGRRIAGRIARDCHPLVAVVHGRGFVFFEAEADVVHHRGVTRQDLHRREPGVALEGSWERNQLPLQNALRRHVVGRQIHDDFRLDDPAVLGPVNRGWRIFGIASHRAGVGPFRRACRSRFASTNDRW